MQLALGASMAGATYAFCFLFETKARAQVHEILLLTYVRQS
jgi:hypothetical protein